MGESEATIVEVTGNETDALAKFLLHTPQVNGFSRVSEAHQICVVADTSADYSRDR